jgi:TonB family protein
VLRIRGDVTLFIEPLTPPPRVIERSLLKVQVPTSHFSAPPRRDEKGSKRVIFPADQLAKGMDGDVSVQYVVGRDGRVTPGTIRLVGATERGFADRILRTLKDARFFPAEIEGCPVPALVTDIHAFRIDRR